MKTFLVLLVLSLTSLGQAMLSGQGVFLVSSPSDFLCKAFSFSQAFTTKPRVQLALFMNETSFTHEAAVNWVEEVKPSGFTACVTASGPISSNRTIVLQWLAYTSVPGGVYSEQGIKIWTTGSKCVEIDFFATTGKSFARMPYVFVTPIHLEIRNKRDAMSVWAEQVTKSGFKICLRELKNFDGSHKSISVDWLAMENAPSGWNIGKEGAVQLPNTDTLTAATHYSFCQVVTFPDEFYSSPIMITTACHFQDVNNAKSIAPQHNAITEWVEQVSKSQFTVCMKDIQPYSGHHDPVTIDYMAIGYLDPCINVQCTHFAVCVAYGPLDARCECPKSCPTFEDLQCGSDGNTYTNMCYWKKYVCETKKNVTIVHAGACYPFILHHGRVSLDLSKAEVKCQLIVYKTQNFMAGRTVHVQLSINYYSSAYTNFVHDAAVAWAEKISINNFTVCALKAGRNERATPDDGSTFVDYMAYQGAPAGAVAGEITLNKWWEGTTCQTISLPTGKFSVTPNALVSSEHMVDGQSHDAATIWVEDTSSKNFKVCLREMQNFDGLHEKVHVNWIAYNTLPADMKAERVSVSFPNTYLPSISDNFAYCQSAVLSGNYTSIPTMIATAKHASAVGNLLPIYNSISVWLEQISLKNFKVCLKELHAPNGYDPVDVTILAIGS